jgi:hypothetical protein
MKKWAIIVTAIVLVGCEPSHPTRINTFNAKLQILKERQDALSATKKQTIERESVFVKQLNDTQLVAYQSANEAFKSDDFSSRELACRNLQQVCDANTYSLAIQILDQKSKLRHESSEIRVEYDALGQEITSIREDQRHGIYH